MEEDTARRLASASEGEFSDANNCADEILIADCDALTIAANRFFSPGGPYHLAEIANADPASLEAARIEQLRLFEAVDTLVTKTAAIAAATGRGAAAKRRAIEAFEQYKREGVADCIEVLKRSYVDDMQRLLLAAGDSISTRGEGDA